MIRLKPEHWNFSLLSNHHLWECLCYELARERHNRGLLTEHDPTIEGIVLQDEPKPGSFIPFTLHEFEFPFLTSWPEFPKKAFLEIPTADRVKRIRKNIDAAQTRRAVRIS